MPAFARILFAAALFLLATPAHSEWYRASSPHFEIYAEGDEAEVRVRAERLERFDAVLRHVGGIDPGQAARPLPIFFLKDVDAIGRMLGSGYGAAAGFYSPRAAGSFAVAPGRTPWSGADSLTPDTILFHEYSHHFLLQNFAAAYPPWFVEGFAEFYATASFGRDGSVTVGGVPQFRVSSLRSGEDFSAQDLLTTGAIDPRSRTIEQFYARSWLLVHHLTFSRQRTGQRARYVAAIERGEPLEQAARGAFGDLRAFEFELRRYINSPIAAATVAASALPAPAIEVRPLTAAEVALLPLRLEHMHRVRPDRAGFAAAVRAVTIRFPTDSAALFLLAEAEGMAGNYDSSDRAADALLAQAPNHSRALLRKAINLEARSGAEGRRAARPLIVRANRSDQADPLPLIAYYRSFGLGVETPPPLALDGLLLAAQLVPQAIDVRLIAGAASVRAGRLDEADEVLRPTAYAPHGGGTAQKAQALLLLVEAARAGPGATPDLVAAAERVLAESLDLS
ncbi:DUF1570 domain-containing protein [Allosphingosinicella sp.]|jgi:hypothetical protein|uniref:DUF1570 domain-containing protein n=1 Tax=Allosphingosinicella sp. TaxID=2823234 RepID=UPI002F065697